MKDTSKWILMTLSERGYRQTKARSMVVEVLEKSRPLTIQELSKKVKVDEASVYRTVEMLVREQLAEEIPVKDERPRFALATHHHHHAICRDCGHIAHVPCSPKPTAPKMVAGFSIIDGHELTFYGLCRKCA